MTNPPNIDQPAAQRSGLPGWVWAAISGAAVLVLLAAGAGVWALLRDRGPQPSAGQTVTASGRVTLDRGSFTWTSPSDPTCYGWSRHEDVKPNAPITVTGPDGTVVAVGRLGYGRAAGISGEFAESCVLTFEIKNVPAGRGIYGIEVSGKGKQQVQESALGSIEISLN